MHKYKKPSGAPKNAEKLTVLTLPSIPTLSPNTQTANLHR